MNRRLAFAPALILVVCVPFVLARHGTDDPDAILARGRDQIAAGTFLEAARTLETVPGDVGRDPVAKEALVLRIHALVLAKKGDEAASLAVKALAGWPEDEPWRGRTNSLLAKATEVQGKVAEAATIELERAKVVLSDEHRARVAATFFAWADRFAKGEKSPDAVRPEIPPDPARAIQAYRLGIDALDRDTASAPHWVEVARLHLVLKQANEADAAGRRALEIGINNPKSLTEERMFAAHAYRAEAQLLLGRTVDARTELLELLRSRAPDETAWGPRALILLGRSHVADGGAEGLALAKDAYGKFLKTWPDRPEAGPVRRAIAEACLAQGALEQAISALKDIVDAPKTSGDDLAWARVQTGRAFFQLNRFDEARAAYQQFLAQHAAHPEVPNVQRALPECLLGKAKLLLTDKKREEAIKVYREFVEVYPLSEQAPAISLEIGNEYRQLKNFDAARDAFRDARERYRTAQPEWAARAGLQVGIIEEDDRRELEAAAEAYRVVVMSFSNTRPASDANARLARLTGIELELTSPRIFAPTEAATIDLATRNVREATVRLYKLDARTYFERKGTLTGTDALDVALVKADLTFTHPVTDYVRYRRDRTSVALKIGDKALPEGTYVVTAEAEQRRAVVLVVVSRVMLVVKQAPTEVFAWATDTVSGAPIADVEVIVRGKALKDSRKTGADGTVRFAVKEGQGPCEVIGALGASVAPGLAANPAAGGKTALTPRVHFAFDRPIYRPGDAVRWSMILRAVADGSFVTPEKQEVQVSWIDPRGRTLYQSKHTTGAFGTIDGQFRMPSDGAVGDYSLRVEFASQVFNEAVTCKAFVKPELRVTAKVANAVVRPGDSVPVKVAVESLVGGVIGGSPYDWRVWRVPTTFDATRYREASWFYHAVEKTKDPTPEPDWTFVANGSGGTDEKGEAEFSFTTASAAGAWRYIAVVTVQDLTHQVVSGSASAYACWTPGNVIVLPDRRTYRAGDRITARVIGVDWASQPLPAKGKAQLIALRSEGGRMVEVVVADAPVDLGASGEAEVKLDAPKAGTHLVRFAGEDGKGMKVVGEAGAEVSGDRPDLAKETRILFEREVYRAGEKARLFIEVPSAPVTGLLTFEGETVLMHRVITVSEKASVVEIEMPELLAPNVVASWAVPHDHALLMCDDPVVVLRYLDVTLKPSADVARPGETVKLAMRATDQAGKPVAAALTLAMSDGALDALGGVGTQDPRFIFNRDVRPHLVKTGASHAFRVDAVARAIDSDVVGLDRSLTLLAAGEELRKNADKAYALKERESVALKAGLEDSLAANAPGAPAAADPPTGGGAGGGKGSAFGGSRSKRRSSDAEKSKSDAKPGEAARVAQRLGGKDDLERGEEAHDAEERAGLGEWGDGAVLFQSATYGLAYRGLEQLPVGNTIAVPQLFVRADPKIAHSWKFPAPSLQPMQSGGSFGFLGGAGEGLLRGGLATAPPEVREVLVDVAAWHPNVITNEAGESSVDVKVPDNLTVWSVNVTGTNRQVAVGRTSANVKVRKDVVVRLAEPRFLFHTDEAVLPVIGQNTLGESVRMTLTLKADAPGVVSLEGAAELEKDVLARTATSMDVRVKARGSGSTRLEVQALSSRASDALVHTLDVVPFGEPWRTVEHRILGDKVTVPVEIPFDPVTGSVGGSVVVQGGLALELLDGLAFLRSVSHGGLEQTVNRFVPAYLLNQAFAAASQPSPLDADAVAQLAKSSLQEMRGFQNDDGGFGFWPGRPSEPEPTAIALDAFARLRGAGFAPPTELVSSSAAGAQSLLAQGRFTRDQRTWLVYALASIGAAPSAEINALYRDRESLSTPSLARLLLAAVADRREAIVPTLLETLRGRRRNPGADQVDFWPFGGIARDPWLGSDQETTALCLLALQASGGRPDEIEGLVRRLRREIAVRGCFHTRATATSVLALVRFVQGEGAAALQGEVSVQLDGRPVGDPVTIDGKNPRAVISIPQERLTPGKHTFVVQRTGGGEADCRVVVTGVKPADTVAAAGNVVAVERRVVAYQDPDRVEPKWRDGFNCVEESKRPVFVPPPSLAQTVVGRKVTVRVVMKVREDVNYLVVEEPQLAGLDVIETGVRGPFDRFERRGSALVFFFDHLKKGSEITITYPCFAVFAGRFSALPTGASEMYAPEVWGRSDSMRLEVLVDASSMATPPPAEKTPDARIAAAASAFDKSRFEDVVALLAELPSKYALTDAAHDDVLRMLQIAYLRLDQSQQAIRVRDTLLMRNPTKTDLSVADTLRLGRSYIAVGDPERAREQFLRVFEAAFTHECKPARFLSEIGRGDDAVAWLEQAVARYPAAGSVPAVEREIAGLYAGLIDPAVKGPVAKDVQRSQWKNAVTAYSRLMAWHPLGSLAEAAHFNRIGVFTALGASQRVVLETAAFRERFQKSLLLDQVLADEARALFELGKYGDVKPLARRVIDEKWRTPADPNGDARESSERPAMAYLLGKIAHIEGQLDEAVKWYGEARNAVPDAMQSWKFFTEHELDVASVTTLVPGAGRTLDVRAKNVTKLTAQVFPVDLTVLFAVRKSFSKLNQADLSGIAPQHTVTHETGLAAYKSGTVKLPLPDLGAGAYLVVVSDGERSVTTVLLATEWTLRLQRDETGLRAWLVDGKDQPVRGARITVGANGKVWFAGSTDERGMLLISNAGDGAVTAVAELADRVAVAER